MSNNFDSTSGPVSSCLVHHYPYPCPQCTSIKFPIPIDRAHNECCDKHGWWVKTAVTKECQMCYNEVKRNSNE